LWWQAKGKKMKGPGRDMSWNSAIEQQMSSEVGNAHKQVQDNLATIVASAPAAALNLSGAAEQITASKSAVEQGIRLIQQTTNTIRETIDGITQSTEHTNDQLKARKAEIEDLKAKVAESKTLYELRKDQATELADKYEGNYHTSWLGLWKPLTAESQFGLLVAAIIFGVVAVLTIAYLFLSVSPVSNRYVGGFLKFGRLR